MTEIFALNAIEKDHLNIKTKELDFLTLFNRRNKMKYILLILTILFFSIYSQADDKKIIKNETQKIEEKQTMSDEEFLKKFMELDKEVQEEEAKLKELEKLEKTANELAKTLGVDK